MPLFSHALLKEGYKKMRKLSKNIKALSPVVAAIILIAVTVAVSIAVAAWMGALTFTFMKTEQLSFTKVAFSGNSGNATNTITVTVQNTGTSDVTLTEARVTGYLVDKTIDYTDVTISKGSSGSVTLSSVGWTSGKAYNIELHSSQGNKFPTTETANPT